MDVDRLLELIVFTVVTWDLALEVQYSREFHILYALLGKELNTHR